MYSLTLKTYVHVQVLYMKPQMLINMNSRLQTFTKAIPAVQQHCLMIHFIMQCAAPSTSSVTKLMYFLCSSTAPTLFNC